MARNATAIARSRHSFRGFHALTDVNEYRRHISLVLLMREDAGCPERNKRPGWIAPEEVTHVRMAQDE